MTFYERQIGFHDRHVPDRPAMATWPTVRSAILLAALLAYAIGFAILYPLAQASASKSAAEGNDPGADRFRQPLIQSGSPRRRAEPRRNSVAPPACA